MKFTLKTLISKNSRLGELSQIKGKENVKLETPMLLLHTQGGHVPHITHEVLKLVSKQQPQMLQLPMASLYCYQEALELYNGVISHFIGNKECITCIVLQDPSDLTRQGHHAKEQIPIFTKYGKVMFDSEKYMNMIELLKPDMYCLLSDGDTNIASPQKRITKAVENTIVFNRQCLNRHRKSKVLQDAFVLAPIAGGYCLKSRQKCLDSIILNNDDVQGYLIDGLHNNGPEVELINFDEIKPVIEHTVNHVPVDKLRVIFGCWNPLNVIKLIKGGIDVFDTSYCKILTNRSAALTFRMDEDTYQSNDMDEYEINLLDTKYSEDFQPILSNCGCLTCTGYSRAYIHHLLTVQELLGPILLMAHNVWYFLKFFKVIRQAINDGTIDQLECTIMRQFGKN